MIAQEIVDDLEAAPEQFRLIVNEGNTSFKDIVERLNDMDRADHEKSRVITKETSRGWEAMAA